MHTKITVFIFSVLIAFGIQSESILALQPIGGQILFYEDFSGETFSPQITINGGSYLLEDGALQITSSEQMFMMIAPGVPWENYSLEVQMTLQVGRVWLQSRTGTNGCGGYYFSIDPIFKSLDGFFSSINCRLRILRNQSGATIPTDTSITARLDVADDLISGFIDGEQVFSFEHWTYDEGFPTIYIFPTATKSALVSIDQITVRNLGEQFVWDGWQTQSTFAQPPENQDPNLPQVTVIQGNVTRSSGDTPTEENTSEAGVSPGTSDNPIQIFGSGGTTLDDTDSDSLSTDDLPPLLLPFELSNSPDIMEQLQLEGMIEQQGRLLFQEEFIVFRRAGSWFYPLGDEEPITNLVVGGEITFYSERDGAIEYCIISTRIGRDEEGHGVTFLDIAINNRGQVLVSDTRINSAENFIQTGSIDIDQQEANNLLLIVKGDRLLVYVNGELIFDRIQVEERAGIIGLSAETTSHESRCEARNIWGYSLDDR